MIGTQQERMAALDALYPAWEKCTLWTRLRKNAERFADREFVIFEDAAYTYRETVEQVEKTARSLIALGVHPGDHVGLFLNNCPEFVFLIFALSEIGAVEVPINPRLKDAELRHILKNMDVRFLLGNAALPALASEDTAALKSCVLEQPILCGCPVLSWDSFWKAGEQISQERLRQISDSCQDPDAMSTIIFTSGSTTMPKGVMMRHDMMLRAAYGTCRCRCMEVGRRLCVPLPLFHAMGFIEGLLTMLLVGGAAILSRERFQPAHILQMMREHGANDIICLTPMMINILTKCEIHAADYPQVHAAYFAATTPEWVWDAVRKAFGIRDVTTAYGMSECGSTLVMVSSADSEDKVTWCHGRLKPGGAAAAPGLDGKMNEMKICDPETGEELSVGQLGELYYRGLTVTKGYYNNPEATAEALAGDGWFRTGDIGYIDGEGYLSFQGRCNDTYKINGENVSPQFLDNMIGQCEWVSAVETVGIAHDRLGAVGVAFIEPTDYSEQTKERIKQYCRDNLACFQIPKYFIFSSNQCWPRTGTGKIQKKQLKTVASELVSIFKGETASLEVAL